MFKNIHISNFKGFENFYLDKLTLVNLITGKNAVGKSNLIKAFFIQGVETDIELLLSFIFGENLSQISKYRNANLITTRVKSLFYNSYLNRPIVIKSEFLKDKPKFVETEIRILNNYDVNSKKTFMLCKFENFTKGEDEAHIAFSIQKVYDGTQKENFTILIKNSGIYLVNENRKIKTLGNITYFSTPTNEDLYKLLKTNDLLKNKEKVFLIENLKDLGFDIFDIFLENEEVYVYLGNKYNVFSAADLGKGFMKIVYILANLISLRMNNGGVFIVESIEDNIHHSILDKFWNIVYSLCKNSNIQFIGIVQSYQCILKACMTRPSNETLHLYRISAKGSYISAKTFDGKELEEMIEFTIEI